MAQHDEGERRFWTRLGIDPLSVAIDLWIARHLDDMVKVVARARRWR